MRIESDSLGEKQILDTVYYGIHTLRAIENFKLSRYSLHPQFIIAFAQVKKAAAQTNIELGYLEDGKGKAIIDACNELINGKLHDQIKVDPFQGGAGTSTNMNINEVIANRALEIFGKNKGEYSYINPIDDVNMHQSTNDVYPTALKITVLQMLRNLETEISTLQEEFQKKELQFKNVLKIGRTELQDAIPMTVGMEFGAFAEAIARDRWRIFKSRERIKVVSIGGTAIGTGLGAPREYIMRVIDKLRDITGLNISRGENLIDTTANMDPLVEVSGMIKTYATNLLKISNDLRLLSCGPDSGICELKLPSVQAGSSIMPGKVNPVILESTGQIAIKVIANDQIISLVSGLGQLQINQFLPILAHSILESLELLHNTTIMLKDKCIKEIDVDEQKCLELVLKSKVIATILVPVLGYKKVEFIVKKAINNNKTIQQILIEDKIMNENEVEKLLSPKRMYKLGFTNDDYVEFKKEIKDEQ